MPDAVPPDALPPDALPPPAGTALLLDLDGTLLDLAPTPDAVRVPDGLPGTLRRLRNHLGGALAVVTGRPIAQIDDLLPGVPYAVAGEHGGAIRHAPDAPVVRAPLPDPPVDWIMEAARIADAHPGALLEQKQRGFVFHYRAVPALGPALRAEADALVATRPDQFRILAALMAWEVKPRGADKGTAVRSLMTRPPFAGRLPIFIGDDVTDEDGMEVARAMGGAGLRVDAAFGTAAGVRNWLAASVAPVVAGAGWAPLPGAIGE